MPIRSRRMPDVEDHVTTEVLDHLANPQLPYLGEQQRVGDRVFTLVERPVPMSFDESVSLALRPSVRTASSYISVV